MRKLTKEEFQQKINKAHPKENLSILGEYIDRKSDLIVKCNNCGEVYVKKAYNFSDARKVSICKKCFPTQSNTLKKDWVPPKDIVLLEDYKGMHNKILVKHTSCGFCWKITPNNLKLGKGCPKCNKKISKGEQKIINWLERHNINYIFQYPLDIENHHFKIDFYLLDFDVFIEYNGIQHFKPIKHFGGQEKFKIQKQHDELKRKYLKEKLLNISYLEFDNIEQILLLKFNDHLERE